MRKIMILILISSFVMTGCGNKKENQQSMPKTTGKNTETPVETMLETAEDMDEEESISFQDIPNQFLFASGAGAWATYMTIEDDGSFVGEYRDSNVGSVGKKHPHGTVHYCDFYGTLSEPEKVNEYTYSVKIKSLKTRVKPGKKEIKDKIKYIYTEPYGLENAKKLLIYLPGAPKSELSEEFLMWTGVGYDWDEDVKEDELSFWGIYNPKDETGFVEYDEN